MKRACPAFTRLPASWPGPCKTALCTLSKHADGIHIDNYLGGFTWRDGGDVVTPSRTDRQPPDSATQAKGGETPVAPLDSQTTD